MKLVGGDSGRVEHEAFVHEVMLAPSERIVVDVLFDQPGSSPSSTGIQNAPIPWPPSLWARPRPSRALSKEFELLRTNADLTAERDRLDRYRDVAPDKTLAFVAEMDMGVPEGPIVYSCPMHPEVISAEEGTAPSAA